MHVKTHTHKVRKRANFMSHAPTCKASCMRQNPHPHIQKKNQCYVTHTHKYQKRGPFHLSSRTYLQGLLRDQVQLPQVQRGKAAARVADAHHGLRVWLIAVCVCGKGGGGRGMKM